MGLDKISPTFFENIHTLGLDLETTAYFEDLPDPFRDRILLVGLSDGKRHLVAEPGEWLEYLWRWIGDPKNMLIGHNLKFDLKFLWEAGLPTRRPKVWDTMIVERILEAGKFTRCGLGPTAWRRASVTLDKTLGQTFRSHLGDFTEQQLEYAKEDVKYLHIIKQAQESGIASWGIEDLIQMENELVPILTETERRGICFDRLLWLEVVEDELQKAREAENHFMQSLGIEPDYGLLGDPRYSINLNSPQQVMEVLQSRCQGYSRLENTSKQTLENYIKEHPESSALRHLLTYREHQKRASFNYPQYINPKTKKIHTNYNQCGTATGRMSSSNPNLQNVVADKRYRRLFRANPGHKLVTADYAQQEMRILAEISGDEALKEACAESDIHLEMARRLFEKPDLQKGEKVELFGHTVEGRYTAKQASFAIVYGAKPETISTLFGVPFPIAKKVVAFVDSEFPQIKFWAQSQIRKAQSQGYVETLSGRRRWFQDLNAENLYKVMNMIRNHPVQGTGADMIKEGIVRVDKVLIEKELPAWLSMTVHDEIVVQCKDGYEQEVAEIVKEEMIKAGQSYINVKTPVDYEINETWEKP